MRINIVGSLLGSTGYDSHCKQFANALFKLNPDIKLDVPLVQGYEQHVNDAELKMVTAKYKIPDVTVAIMTPPFWRIAMGDNCKKFIGFCVWEGDMVPKYWLEYLMDERVDQIWVPSEHTQMAIRTTMERVLNETILPKETFKELTERLYAMKSKIKIVPHGVNINLFKPTTVQRSNNFTFLCNKGWRGGFEDRGGVAYVLKAFAEEFNKGEPVEMLVKLNPAYMDPQMLGQKMAELKLPKDRPVININISNAPYDKIPEFYNKSDVYVCATRAEGFNLPGLEAMACGIPTIQTGYGGQTDYMSDKNSWTIPYELKDVENDFVYEGIKWGLPNVQKLRELMREAFSQREITREKGQQGIIDVKGWTWDITASKAMKFISELQ